MASNTAGPPVGTRNAITFDIEDYFTFRQLVDSHDWARYESQVEENTEAIVRLTAQHRIRATCFVVGRVAHRRPDVVRAIARAGLEVASHGYLHERVARLGRRGFADDLKRSKGLLESLCNQPLLGFRAMAFSLRVDTAWALDVLKEQGFLYDSSIPSSYYLRHIDTFRSYLRDSFHEVCPSAIGIFGRHVNFGGSYFMRCAPLSLVRSLMKREAWAGRPVVVYAHAWEFNRDQPRRKVPFTQSVAQSPWLFTTPKRLEKLLASFNFTSVAELLMGGAAPGPDRVLQWKESRAVGR